MKKPYLLAPCGSFEAVEAAISAGADECYFGGCIHNARMNAKGFTSEEFKRAVDLIKIHGKRANITLNTLITDRELPQAVEFAGAAWHDGADAFIVQDLGLARALKSEIPEIRLHASTQCACHSLDGAIELAKAGFSRIVLARELSLEDIREITSMGKDLYETETFIHGALCVSHSGMCLMSSVIGGRSGNRGYCAQPCRMKGELSSRFGKRVDDIYPLSLRDLTLCNHIREILPLGVSSLKIEGRMKSPEYVYRTVKILRDLIDREEDATPSEYGELSDIFSRGGFTDGYFTKKYLYNNSKMYGFRSESDKRKTASVSFDVPKPSKAAVRLSVSVKKGIPPTARFFLREFVGEYSLPEPAPLAVSAPLTVDGLLKGMRKLGNTDFELSEWDVDLDDGLFLTAASINELRRGAIEALTLSVLSERKTEKDGSGYIAEVERREARKAKIRVITDNPKYDLSKSGCSGELESICLPLELFKNECEVRPSSPFGVRLPRVIFNGETDNVREALCRAAECGALYVYVSNVGHIALARETGLPVYGGMGLNVTNTESARAYADMGITQLTLSTELTTPQIRDIGRVEGVKFAVVCEGRLPVMVLESCILRARGMCHGPENKGTLSCGALTDRIGKTFPIYGEARFDDNASSPCRCIIYNADSLHRYGKWEEIKKWSADILEIYDIAQGKENTEHKNK